MGIALGTTEGFSGINEKWMTPASPRVRLFGFAVAEINYVQPLDRRGRGWLWQFNFSPGFDLEHDRAIERIDRPIRSQVSPRA